MRITQQNLTQNIANISKSTTLPAEVKAMIGKVIQGQITGIQNNQIATLSTGNTQLTVNINGLKLAENQLVNLKIVDFKEGAFIAKFVNNLSTSDQGSSLTEMLSKLGVSDQNDNKMILDALRSANLPITKDNFQLLRQGMVEVKALISELAQNGELPLDVDLETPIKAMALKLIGQSNLDGKSNSIPPSDSNLKGSASVNLQTALNTQIVNNTELIDESAFNKTKSLNVNQQSNQNLNQTLNLIPIDNNEADLPTNVIKVPPEIIVKNETTIQNFNKVGSDQEAMLNAIQTALSKEGASLKEVVSTLLSQFDYKQGSLIMKNELQMTLKNIFLAYDALSEDGGNSNRFKTIIEALDKMPLSKEMITDLTLKLTSDDTQEEKLEAILKSIKNDLPENALKQTLEREITVIKESTTMSKSLNEQMMYMQIPIPINEALQNVALYYKKGKKKADPNDLTLLVALNTFNYGEVRCIIRKLNQNYTLNFNFENSEALETYEMQKDKLTAALENQSDKKFAINFSLKSVISDIGSTDDGVLFDFESFGFDVKV